MIGWMGIPDADYDNEATVSYDWIHALTMPRELRLKDGKLIQRPLEEMKELRKNKFSCDICRFTQWMPEDCCFELHLELKNKNRLEIQLREDVFLIWEEERICLKLGKSGHGRKERFARVKELSDITIFSDTSSIEIFINGGETVMTTRVYSEHLKQKVAVLSEENEGTVTGYELGNMIFNFLN